MHAAALVCAAYASRALCRANLLQHAASPPSRVPGLCTDIHTQMYALHLAPCSLHALANQLSMAGMVICSIQVQFGSTFQLLQEVEFTPDAWAQLSALVARRGIMPPGVQQLLGLELRNCGLDLDEFNRCLEAALERAAISWQGCIRSCTHFPGDPDKAELIQLGAVCKILMKDSKDSSLTIRVGDQALSLRWNGNASALSTADPSVTLAASDDSCKQLQASNCLLLQGRTG